MVKRSLHPKIAFAPVVIINTGSRFSLMFVSPYVFFISTLLIFWDKRL